MDIVGLIKKSYRGYGSLFSDKFKETFLKEDSRNVSAKNLFCFAIFLVRRFNFLSISHVASGLDCHQRFSGCSIDSPKRLLVAQE